RLLGVGEDFRSLIEPIHCLRQLMEVTRAHARVLDPRGGLEAVQAHVDASVAAAANEHGGRREGAVQDTGPVAMGDRFAALLEEPKPLVEGEVRLLADEGMQRQRVRECLEQHRWSEWAVVDERAVCEDAGVLPDLRKRLRFASRRAMELRTAIGTRRG